MLTASLKKPLKMKKKKFSKPESDPTSILISGLPWIVSSFVWINFYLGNTCIFHILMESDGGQKSHWIHWIAILRWYFPRKWILIQYMKLYSCIMSVTLWLLWGFSLSAFQTSCQIFTVLIGHSIRKSSIICVIKYICSFLSIM